MKPMSMADAFSKIDDRYINESHPTAVLATGGKLPRARGPVGEFLHSGWGAAVLSAAAAVLVVSAVIWMGRQGTGGPLVPPAGSLAATETPAVETEPSPSENEKIAGPFAFGYTIESSTGFVPGKHFMLYTTIRNISDEPVLYEGSSSLTDAQFELFCILPDGTELRIDEPRDHTTDIMEYQYQPGIPIKSRVRVDIPADAPLLPCHLRLYYAGDPMYSVVFENVLTIGDKTPVRPAETEDETVRTDDPLVPGDTTPAYPDALGKVGESEYNFGRAYLWSGSLSLPLDGAEIGMHITIDDPPMSGADVVKLAAQNNDMTTVFVVPEDGHYPATDIWNITIGGIAIDKIDSADIYDLNGHHVVSYAPDAPAEESNPERTPRITLGSLPADEYYVCLNVLASGMAHYHEGQMWTVEGGCFNIVFRWVPDHVEVPSETLSPEEAASILPAAAHFEGVAHPLGDAYRWQGTSTLEINGVSTAGMNEEEIEGVASALATVSYPVVYGTNSLPTIIDSITLGGEPITRIINLGVFDREGTRITGRVPLKDVISTDTLLDTLPVGEYYVTIVVESAGPSAATYAIVFRWVPDKT